MQMYNVSIWNRFSIYPYAYNIHNLYTHSLCLTCNIKYITYVNAWQCY